MVVARYLIVEYLDPLDIIHHSIDCHNHDFCRFLIQSPIPKLYVTYKRRVLVVEGMCYYLTLSSAPSPICIYIYIYLYVYLYSYPYAL